MSTPLDSTEEQLYCYGHPKTPTRLRCSRCERPICGKCAIPASVGQHCPECVAEARRSTPKVRSAIRANAPVVYALIAINVVMYALQQISPEITDRFFLFPPAVANGEWWRLFTCMFLHQPDSVLHILFNMYVLFILGPTVEQAYGPIRFVVLYVVAGLMGSAFSYAFPPDAASLGASGAIFGIAGGLLVFLFYRRQNPMANAFLSRIWFFLGLNLVIGIALPNIDLLAHLGGLVGGVAVGAGFHLGRERANAASQYFVAAGVLAAAVVLVALKSAAGV